MCVMRNPAFGVSDQVQHKSDCTTIEDGQNFGFRKIEDFSLILLYSENKGADLLRGFVFARSSCSHNVAQIGSLTVVYLAVS